VNVLQTELFAERPGDGDAVGVDVAAAEVGDQLAHHDPLVAHHHVGRFGAGDEDVAWCLASEDHGSPFARGGRVGAALGVTPV
jgi:hypothetical protein